MTIELDDLKSRLKTTWMAGDFGKIAAAYATGAAEFIDRLRPMRRRQVLDVACGTGNLAIPAARAGARVTGLDVAPNLLAQARQRAAKGRLKIRFDEGDTEQMPYADVAFDLVVSMFGVMFAPWPEVAARELVRVCRAGGRIALANWTREGFVGQLFRITAAHVPPAAVPSPLLWGDEAPVRERLRDGIAELQVTRRHIALCYPFDPPAVVETMRQHYGPTLKAFAALDDCGQAALRRELEGMYAVHNRATNGTTRIEAEYLEVIVLRA